MEQPRDAAALPPGMAPGVSSSAYWQPTPGRTSQAGRGPCGVGGGGRGVPCVGLFGCEDGASGELTYVGEGVGDYVAETSYRFVGNGAGEYTVAPRRLSPGVVLCSLAVLVLLALPAVFLLMPAGTFSTTMRFGGLGFSECSLWGDPHIESFDHARPSFYGEGELWIVKSAPLKIQGRYLGTSYTDGLAAINKVTVSGDLLDGHVVEVGPMDDDAAGGITLDGAPVLRSLGEAIDVYGRASVRYDDQGDLVDEAQSKLPRRVVHLELSMGGARITIFRWKNYMDLRIQMVPVAGQDGSCGNANGDPSDDSAEAMFRRIGARVAPGENLFRNRAPVDITPEMSQMLKTCPPETAARAASECGQALPPPQNTAALMDACKFDVCFGPREHALRTAKTFEGQAAVAQV